MEFSERIFDELAANLEQLPWLNNVFGRAERIVRLSPERKRIKVPCNPLNGEYDELIPSDSLGNYSFFLLHDPQHIEQTFGVSVRMKAEWSLIVWFDLRTIDRESAKRQVLDVLNKGIRSGHVSVHRVYDENIFDGFTIDEVDNQYMMYPYSGIRVVGELNVDEVCLN